MVPALGTYMAHNVRYVRHSCAGRGAQVEHLLAGRDAADVADAAHDGCAQLRPERIPHTVLNLLAVLLNGNALLAVHRLARYQIRRHKRIFLAPRHEDSGMSVGLDEHSLSTPQAAIGAL